jgi:hypothetical protein
MGNRREAKSVEIINEGPKDPGFDSQHVNLKKSEI